MLNKIISIIHKELNIHKDRITAESRLIEDLQLDQIDTVEVIIAIEETFDISITDQEWDKCNKISDVVELVKKKAR